MKNLIHSILILFCSVLFIFLCLIPSTELKSQTTGDNVEESGEAPTTKTTKYKVKKNIFRYNNVFSFYPFQSAINYMTVGYELKTGEKTAFKTIAGYAKQESSLLGFSDISNYSGFKIEMELKYFVNKKSVVFNGIYFAPFAMYKSCQFTFMEDKSYYDPNTGIYHYETVETSGKSGATHIGFLLGYHSKIGESFTLDMFAGEGLMSASGNHEMGSRFGDIYANEIRMKAGICLGFGF